MGILGAIIFIVILLVGLSILLMPILVCLLFIKALRSDDGSKTIYIKTTPPPKKRGRNLTLID
jgi:hypothetical protein